MLVPSSLTKKPVATEEGNEMNARYAQLDNYCTLALGLFPDLEADMSRKGRQAGTEVPDNAS